MSLLREIQGAAIDANVDISVVLRKCKVLAARLGNEEFKLWVERELNGYTSKEDVPDYRILQVESFGFFGGIAGSSMNNAPIPPSAIPEKWKEFITTQYFTEPISFYTHLIKNHSGSDTIKIAWPADLIAYVGNEIYEHMHCVSAWKVISCSAIAALIDTVRNKVLSFVLEIEAEAPDAGEAPPDTKPISEERIAKVFQTVVMGNVTNLAAGNGAIAQSVEITVVKNDLESLKQYLSSLGIGKPDLKELDKAIQEDAKSGVKDTLGDKVKTWIGKMINKSGSTAWNVATSVATQLLIQALSKYYGFSI
ncbi:MAG: hypothetical protein NT134_01025 [Chloroflexi bacterium]|nr:hypothetical protein [Chloroflexota bacterium]